MRLFRNEEEDFDDSAAFDSDNSGVIKIITMIVLGIVVVAAISWFGYTAYQNREPSNETSNETIKVNTTIDPVTNKTVAQPGQVIINFSTFNASVRENPQGIYYYTTQEKVTGENCYIDGERKSCSRLTNSVCSKKTCKKDLVTVTECFVNTEKIVCL